MSVTLRAMGPAVSRTELRGTIPVREMSPTVGRSPARALYADGMRTAPPVSVPHATMPKLAARAAPDPPDEPPVANAVLYGLRAKPEITELTLSVIPRANSESDDFARMMLPAARSLFTSGASSAG